MDAVVQAASSHLGRLLGRDVPPAELAWAATTALAGALIAWVLQVLLLGTWRRGVAGLPGPKPWPLVGNLPSLRDRSRRSAVLLQWSERFGGLFTVWLGRQPCLVVTDPAAAHELLVAHAAKLIKPRDVAVALAELVPGGGLCLLTHASSASDGWRAARKCLAHSFSVEELSLDCEAARAKALNLCEVLASVGPGVSVDVFDAVTRAGLDSFGLAKLGYDFGSVETPDEVMLLRLLRECSSEWVARRRWPLRPWLAWAHDGVAEGRQKYAMLRDFIGVLWESLAGGGEAGRAPPPPLEDGDVTLAAQLRRLRNPRTGAKAAEAVVQGELGGLLLGAHEPLACCVCWAVFLLAAHPAAQEALHAELLAAGVVDDPDVLTLQALGQLRVLDGVVRETLRLYPPWGEGVVRELGEPLTLASASSTHRATGSKKPGQGLRLPAGTRVWVHTYAMQRRSAVWERGKEFLPERWWAPRRRPFTAAASGGKGAAAAGQPAAVAPFDGMASCPDVCDAAPLLSPPAPAEEEARAAGGGEEAEAGPRLCAPEGFLPFGAGPRGCLGQAFAQVHAKVCVALLACYFKFELLGDERSELYASSAGLTLAPKGGVLPVALTLRYPEMFQAAA